jgi:glycolate oxidase
MNKSIKIDIENNLVELQPGVICDDLNEILKKEGYFFPPDPGSSSVATIGGMVATNAGGVQAFKYGVTQNYVLSIEVILANGKMLHLGTDVLKSVSSYNIKDLLIGSEGTLGVITEITLKIRPLPKYRKLGFFIFDDVTEIQNAVLDIRKEGIVPNLLEFMGKKILEAVKEYMGGEFHDYPSGYALLAEVDGESQTSVDELFSKMFDLIIQKDPIFTKIARNDLERDNLIRARKANLPAASRIKPTVCVEDCTIKVTEFANVINQIEKIPEKIGAKNLKVAVISHMEGNLHPKFLFNENNPEDLIDFQKAMDYLYNEIILPSGGTLTGEHGIGKVKTPYIEQEHGKEVVELMNKIKDLFDPKGILNPGIGKGDPQELQDLPDERTLKHQPNNILELNCIRCGFCQISCPSRLHYYSEAYSPRGRLSILNGLVYGDLEPSDLINKIFHTCTLCGLCFEKCPAGVETYKIFEKAREILHRKR